MKTFKFIPASEVSNYDAALIVENTESIYRLEDWLCTCVAKKLARGITPDFEQLAASSTVGKMLALIDKELITVDCPKMTKEERKELRNWIANNIFYEAQNEA